MSAKSIVWVHRLGPQLASYRYRAAMPCEEVGKLNGFKTAVNDGNADIVVFSKPIEMDLETARTAKAEGAKIVVDLADDNFGTPARDTYIAFAELADAIVTGSEVMRARLQDYVKRDSCVIGDPYEQEECAPHADGDAFLWFGHLRNFRELTSIMPLLGTRKLRVCTGPQPTPGTIPWTPENMKKAFDLSNIVLLPTMPGHEYKSPNRLLNSIRAGCFPVCMTHPAYAEFRHLVWVGNPQRGFQTGLRWIDAFRGDLNGLGARAQDYIRERYSPAAIGAKWASFLDSV